METVNFELLHTVLYAKNWYKARRYLSDKYMPSYYDKEVVKEEEYSFEYENNFRGIWWDLAKVLTVDASEKYYAVFYNKNGWDKIIPDVNYMINFLVLKCNELFKAINPENNPLDLLNVRAGISKYNCHKYGYYFKGSPWNIAKDCTNEYDPDEALVWYILSNLAMVEIKHIGGKLPKPDYKNVLPRKQGDY